MYNYDRIPTKRPPPSEDEMAYVRALLAPMEAKFPDLAAPKPKRVFPKRPVKRFTEEELIAAYTIDGGAAILIELARRRIAARSVEGIMDESIVTG